MAFQQGANLYAVGFGSRPEGVEVPFVASRAPTARDTLFPVGKRWIFTGTGEYILLNFTVVSGVLSANWQVAAAAAGTVATLSGDSGTATPSAGDIQIAGTTDQIETVGSGNAVTLSLADPLVAPGSVEATTSLTATSGDITATDGNLVLGTAGNKLEIATGSNASMGTSAAMTAGAITISTTAVTASSIIFLSANTLGGTPGVLRAETGDIVDGVSFDITSSSNSDTSTVNWLIIN